MTEMSVEEKREYLELYALQQARINRYSMLSARNADKMEKYKTQISSAMSLRDIIEDDIDKMQDKRESEILAQKYLCGKSLEETAYMLNYSRRQVERLHLSGLENLRPSIEKVKGMGEKREYGKNNITLRPQ